MDELTGQQHNTLVLLGRFVLPCKGGLMVVWRGLKVSLALEYSENASTDSVLPEISTCDGSKTTSGLSWDLDKLSNCLTMHCNYEKE